MNRGKLPFGSEFSPSQIDLAEVLELADRHADDWRAFEAAVRERYFDGHRTTEYNRDKLANNTRLGMIAYGIVERVGGLTDFGRSLHEVRHNETELHDRLARHILLHLHGMTLIRSILDMTAAGEQVNLTSLRPALADRGVDFPRGGKHPSMMRLWLAKAGVIVGTRWRVDEDRIRRILGQGPDDFAALSDLTRPQRDFLRALANTDRTGPQPASEIVRLAEATFGTGFPEKSLPKLVLNALVDAGYITVTKTTSGRGAKPFLVAPTAKLRADLVEPLLKQLTGRLEPGVAALLRRPFADVVAGLADGNRHAAGLALEALAFKLMRLLDMNFVGTRLRGSRTGGAEVDLIFESARLVFTRWQIQCKNTSHVSLDDVAKEVGLTQFLKSNAIVVVTTGRIGQGARRYSDAIMAQSNLAIVLLDGKDLEGIADNPAYIVRAFEREAKHAMVLKKLNLDP